MIDLEKLLEAVGKIDKLFKLGQALAKLANAHKEIIKKQYPDVLPPDLDVDFEAILADEVEPDSPPSEPPQ